MSAATASILRGNLLPWNPAQRTAGIRCPGLALYEVSPAVRTATSGSGWLTRVELGRTVRRG